MRELAKYPVVRPWDWKLDVVASDQDKLLESALASVDFEQDTTDLKTESSSGPLLADSFPEALELMLSRHFSQELSRTLAQKFMSNYACSLESLSLDDIERLCRSLSDGTDRLYA